MPIVNKKKIDKQLAKALVKNKLVKKKKTKAVIEYLLFTQRGNSLKNLMIFFMKQKY